MTAQHELARVELLQIKALKDEMILRQTIKLLEEFILIQLVDDKELLCESAVQQVDLLEVILA